MAIPATMAMPKASTNLDRRMIFGEDNVGIPRKVPSVQAETMAQTVQCLPDLHLGDRIF
jgi:hypothetical protein